MIGAILGDVIGSRFEFDNLLSTEFDLFSSKSTFTDDTICTLAVADWLMEAKENGKTNARRAAYFIRHYCNQFPGLSYGGNFAIWLKNPDSPAWRSDSLGNGAAMRISPVGLGMYTPEKVKTFSELATRVTHGHPEGLKGAEAIAMVIYLALRGAEKKDIAETIEEYGYDIRWNLSDLRGRYWFDETCPGTIPPAIVAFLESTDFESAIRLAVSVGGDSDTLAAITGSIAEAYYQKIPSDLIKKAEAILGPDLWHIVKRFYTTFDLNYLTL